MEKYLQRVIKPKAGRWRGGRMLWAALLATLLAGVLPIRARADGVAAEALAQQAGLSAEAFREISSYVETRNVVDVDLLLLRSGVPLEVVESWSERSPATKIALAVKHASSASEENGRGLVSLLAHSLSSAYPSLRASKSLAPLLTTPPPERVLWPEMSMQAKRVPEWAAEPTLELIRYASADGVVSVADFARLTPISPVEKVEILAGSRNDKDSFAGLIDATYNHYLRDGLNAKQAKARTEEYVGSCASLVMEHYPSAGQNATIRKWANLASHWPEGALPLARNALSWGAPPGQPPHRPSPGPDTSGGEPPSSSPPGGPPPRPTGPPGGSGAGVSEGGGSSPLTQAEGRVDKKSGLRIVAGGADFRIPTAEALNIPSSAVSPKYSAPTMTAKYMRSSSKLFRFAGGVMLDKESNPCAALLSRLGKGKQGASREGVGLIHDGNQPDGRRLLLTIGEEKLVVPNITDSELRSIVEFVDDQRPVIANLLGRLPGEAESCSRPGNLLVVELHPAFQDTPLGWALARADMLPWSLMMGSRWHTGERVESSESTQALSHELTSVLRKETQSNQTRSLRAAAKKEGVRLSKDDEEFFVLLAEAGLVRVSTETSNINDVHAAPGFCVNKSEVVFTGAPRIEFFGRQEGKAELLPKSSQLATRRQSALLEVDAEAYEALLKVFNFGALFRHVKKTSPQSWSNFHKAIMKLDRGAANYQTPSIVCTQCSRASVERWLQRCVTSAEEAPQAGPANP